MVRTKSSKITEGTLVSKIARLERHLNALEKHQLWNSGQPGYGFNLTVAQLQEQFHPNQLHQPDLK